MGITVGALKEHILKFMTADEALEKLLASTILKYEKLKFQNKEDAVHPEIIIALAAMDLGWMIAVEKSDKHPNVRGLIVGTEEYFEDYKKEKDGKV